MTGVAHVTFLCLSNRQVNPAVWSAASAISTSSAATRLKRRIDKVLDLPRCCGVNPAARMEKNAHGRGRSASKSSRAGSDDSARHIGETRQWRCHDHDARDALTGCPTAVERDLKIGIWYPVRHRARPACRGQVG